MVIRPTGTGARRQPLRAQTEGLRLRSPARSQPLPTSSLLDTIAVALTVAAPTIAKGVIVRRPKIVALLAATGLESRAIRTLQRLRARYGDGPLLLRGTGYAIVLAPPDLERVLEETPEPFSAATSEKRAALAHFEPRVALITYGPKRGERRLFNDRVLEPEREVHSMAESIVTVVEQEMGALCDELGEDGFLAWDRFIPAWFRMVRSLVLGARAREDEALTGIQERLRGRGNWAFFAPQNPGLRDEFHVRLNAHLARGEAGSLAGIIARVPKSADTAPSDQVAQWMFAFDPAGMAAFRTLALLATHPEQFARAKREASDREARRNNQLRFLRACYLESLRLWPTTPMILRQTTEETQWEKGRMPKNTGVLLYAPYFHRDDERFDFAHRFAPDVWLETDQRRPFVPFSGGKAICPAFNLVPMIASAALATLIGGRRITLEQGPRLGPDTALPPTLDNYALQFRMQREA